MTKSHRNYQREKYIHHYIQSLDQGDMDGVAEVLEASLSDPELDRIITEINLAYHEEENLTSVATDAKLVRELLQKYLVSAYESLKETQSIHQVKDPKIEENRPLTVGDVALRLKESYQFNNTEDEILERLTNSTILIPKSLTIKATRKLFNEQLKQPVSSKFLNSFRDTAIMLGMGRSQNQVQLAAARQQKGRYSTPKKQDK